MVSLKDQILAVRREVGLRKGVYPNMVRGGRMTQEKADHETAAMEAALVTLEWLSERFAAFNVETPLEYEAVIKLNFDGG